MITQAKYAWHHVNTYDITSTLYDITPRYDIHRHCIHVNTPRIPVVASTVAELLLTLYWLEHGCNMCYIKPLYVWHHMNSMWYHSHFYWHQKTVFMTSYPQYSWIQNRLYTTWHTLHLWHHSHCNCDKTPAIFLTWYSVYMRSHPLSEWQHNDCIWHDTQCICVIKPTWLMTSQPMYVWNHTHCMHEP